MSLRFVLSIAVAGWVTFLGGGVCRADPPPLAEFKDKSLMGFELELDPPEFSRVVSFFDWDEFEKKRKSGLPDALLDSYLEDNPNAFDSLSEQIKAELTQGLQHLNQTIYSGPEPVPVLHERVVLDAQGNPLKRERPSVVVPRASGESVPVARRPPSVQGRAWDETGGLILPENTRAQSDWTEILRRWRNLRRSERVESVRLGNILPRKLAHLVLTRDPFRDGLSSLKLRSDLPQSLLQTFEGLEWVPDLDAIEFRPKAPSSDPENAVRQLKALGGLVGIRDFRAAGVHLHLSIPSAVSLASRIRKIRMIQALEIAAEGHARAIFSTEMNSFGKSLSQKGVVRVISGHPAHIEVRELTSDPETQTRRVLHWLSNEPALNQALSQKLEAFDPKWVEMIADNSFVQREFLNDLELFARDPDLHLEPVVQKLTRAFSKCLGRVESVLRRPP